MKKTILILTIFTSIFTSSLFANYAYDGDNMGKIDMHGGKKQNLVPNNMKLNNFGGLNGLNDLSINKPTNPKKPEIKKLIENEKKENNE